VARKRPDPMSPQIHYTYAFPPKRARLLVRHLRYVQHACNAFGKEASKVMECLLLCGRMAAKDAIWGAQELARRKRTQSLHKNGGSGDDNGSVDGNDNDRGRGQQ
jgi:hypothetical protein